MLEMIRSHLVRLTPEKAGKQIVSYCCHGLVKAMGRSEQAPQQPRSSSKKHIRRDARVYVEICKL
jgi:hypothetical protein